MRASNKPANRTTVKRYVIMLPYQERGRSQTARNRSLAMRKAVRTPKTRQIRRKETMIHTTVRNAVTERLTKTWDFNEEQLADLSIFHLVNILMLLAGQYGYIGQFAPTIYALRQTLGDDQVFDRPSELRAKSNTSDTELVEPLTEDKEFVN
jgi:hypothetical protein